MALAIFDLDETLLEGDSDVRWWQFLAEHNLVAAEDFIAKLSMRVFTPIGKWFVPTAPGADLAVSVADM